MLNIVLATSGYKLGFANFAFVNRPASPFAQRRVLAAKMKFMFARLAIIFLLITAVCLFRAYAQDNAPQTTIKGYVMDDDGNPLPGAYVYDADKVFTAITDGDGYFELTVTSTVKFLKADFVGFETLDYEIERIGDTQILVLVSSAALEEVTVTADGLGAGKSRFGTLNTESISTRALTRAACCNLSESFENNPSVDVSYSDAVTGAQQIQLLGLAGTYVQTLTENFPNLRGAAAVYGLDYIPGPWMQSIQVSKGAASVRNGFESVTGQINVEYKKPKVADPLFVNLFAGDVGRYEGNVIGALELNDRLSTALFVNYYNETRAHDKNGDSFLDMPKTHSLSVMNRWHYQTQGFVSQTGVKILTDNRKSGQTSHSMDLTDDPYTVTTTVGRVEFFTKNGFVLNSVTNESVALIVSGSYHDQQSLYATNSYNVYQTNLYAALLYERDFAHAHKLAAGLNYNWDKYGQRGNVVEAYSPWWRDVNEHVAGGYAEYTWKPAGTFTFMAGVRADYSTMYKWFATPRVHLKYDPFPWLAIRASAGMGYRTSLVLPENHYLLASSRELSIAEDLKQEKAWNYGISGSLYIPLRDETLVVNLECYRTDFKNQTVTDLDADPHAVLFYNLTGKSYSTVFQIDATYPAFRGFELMAAYRWMNVKSDYITRGRLRKPLTGRYKALFTASYQTPLKRWQFDVTLQLNGGGRMPIPDSENPLWENTFPSFACLNAQITKRFRRFDIYAGGENITNYKQKNLIIASDNPYGPDFDATLIWGPTMGRKLYVGVRYSISKI